MSIGRRLRKIHPDGDEFFYERPGQVLCRVRISDTMWGVCALYTPLSEHDLHDLILQVKIKTQQEEFSQ